MDIRIKARSLASICLTSECLGSNIGGREGEIRVQGFGFRVWGLGFRVCDLSFRVQGLGFGVSGVRVEGRFRKLMVPLQAHLELL